MLPKITIYSGDITEAGANFLVNSSNGYLLHGSGTAGQIRNRLGKLVDREALIDYQNMISGAEWPLKPTLDYMHNIQKREPSVFQYESLKHIIRERKSKPVMRGDAVLLTFKDFAVSNAVGMTYDWEENSNQVSLPIIPATKDTVKFSLQKSLVFAETLVCGNVAMPIMCTRKGGLKKDESAGATASALKTHFSKYRDSAIGEIIIVLYDKELQAEEEYFKGYFGSVSESI
jgi:O-acetyl-ADP-ribose deacetylase (regulator of RNase III)